MMGWLRAWWIGQRLQRRIARGEQTWGRQPEPGLGVRTAPQVTIAAKVRRAGSAQWDDLGVIARSDPEAKD